MLKLGIKIAVFSILFVLGLSFTDALFKERRISKFSRDAYLKIDTNVDIAIFGSSHGLNGIDPRFLQKELKKTTFNFCSGGQRMVSTMPVVDEILGSNAVELAIVDIFYGTVSSLRSFEKKTKFFQYNTLDNLDFSMSKLLTHNEIYGPLELYNMSPTLRRHQNWVDVATGLEYVPDISSDINNGFFTCFFHNKEVWDKSIIRAKKNKGRDIILESLKDDERENMDRIIAKFKAYDVPALFISTPFFQDTLGQRNRSHQELIVNYMKDQGADVLDFNLLWDELKFEQEDFIDVGHLNTRGAIKASSYLAKYVKENYQFNAKTIDEKDLSQNRYAIIDNDFETLIHEQEFDSLSEVGKNGIAKLYVYQTYDNRYEILFEGIESDFDGLELRYQHHYDSEEEDKITKYQRRFIKENGVVSNRRRFDHNISYKGKEYQVYQFNSVFDKLINFKLFLISGKERIEILKFDELILRNGNR